MENKDSQIHQKIQRVQQRLEYKKNWFTEKILNLEIRLQEYTDKKNKLLSNYQSLIAQK